MKSCSDFNLDAILDWRHHLSQSPQLRAENLDELEAHLRDAIASMKGQRLTDEEIFLITTRRIGGAAALEPEFAKVNAREVWLGRALWMLVGIQAAWIFRALCGLTQLGVTLGLQSAGFPFGPEGRGLHAALLIAGQLLIVAGMLGGLYWLIRRKPRCLSWLSQTRSLGIVSVLSLILFTAGSRIVPVAFMTGMSPQHMQAAGYAMVISNIVLFVVQTIVLPVLTIVLARRQLVSRA